MKKPDFTKKILNSLSGKKAVSLPEIKQGILRRETPGEVVSTSLPQGTAMKYAVTRSIKNLADSGLIELLEGGQGQFIRLTKPGRMKATSDKLKAESSLVDPAWDGKWRIVLLDLPEARKAEREALRYLLKKAGFMMLKNSAWVSPFPFEFLFQNLKKDFGLDNELMIIVTDSLDPETEKNIRKEYGM